jgi:GT2 family glycosyltransferase
MKTTAAADPLIDLVDAVWPECTNLLRELDDLADVSGRTAWSARPARTRLARPDAGDAGPIDVSVITPCFNQGTLLLEAIASVERTAPERCELVIVNDGSTEPRTLAVLARLKALGYYVHDQENRGLSAARNAAIAMARGRYILPLDDDNRLRPRFIADAVAALDAEAAVGVVYGDRQDFGLRNGTVTVPEIDLRGMLEVNHIDACAVFRREIWAECGGYDASLSPLEDYDLWLSALARGWKFRRLPYVTFDYRVRPASLLAQIGDWRCEYRPKIQRKHIALYASVAMEQVTELAKTVAEQARRLQALEAEGTARRAEAEALREQLARCEGELRRIQSFWPWRVWMRWVQWRSAW